MGSIARIGNLDSPLAGQLSQVLHFRFWSNLNVLWYRHFEREYTGLNDYKYNIVEKDKGLKTEVMPAYLSVVNNVRFLNVFIKDSSDEGYMFYRIHNVDAKAGTISFSTVGDSTLKYLYNTTEVRKYIAKRMNDRDFYSDTTFMVRMK